MKNSSKGQMLFGEVEVDETFVGGLAKNRHVGKRFPGGGMGGAGSRKKPVVGAISRAGKVVAQVVDSVDGATLKAFVRQAVSEKVTLLVTDQWVGYRGLSPTFPQGVINHAKGQYVVRAVHTSAQRNPSNAGREGAVPAKKSDEKRNPQQALADKPDAHSAEVAFDDIIEALLNCDPKAIREQRRRKNESRPHFP